MILCFNNLDEPAGSVKREDAPKSLLSGLGNRPWLVLGGGTPRGLAHIGVWQGLQTAGVRFEGVIGTSIGGLVAVALAAGRTAPELDDIARHLRKRDILRLDRGAVWLNGIREGSVFRGDVLRSQFETILPAGGWGDLEFQVQVNAVDLGTGELEWFGSNVREDVSLLDAVCATTALPVLFPPVAIGDRWYVDGGTREALGIERAQALGATGILAIDVGAGGAVDADEVVGNGLVAVHQRVFSIMAEARRLETVNEWEGVPLVYARPELDGFKGFDFKAIPHFLEEGQRVAQELVGG